MPVVSTACPVNCYSTCTIRVEVEDGRIRRVEPDSLNAATATGPCLKGLSWVERVHSPDRILTPLRRRPGRAPFERIGWDEALDEIAGRLLRLREEHGPQSLMYYAGSGTKGLLNRLGLDFWRLYGGCTTTYGDLCWPAGLEATRLTLGENKHNAPWDLVQARLVVLWGKNPAATNLQQMPFLEQALSTGARLVVIDPRRTESADRAEWLIQPRPGTDGALALGLARLIEEQGRVDRVFVEAHVKGYAEFRDLLRPYTPERVAEISGVRPDCLYRLAGMIGEIRPVTICGGFGLQRYTNSGQTVRAIIALLAITGNIGRPGAGWQFANLQSHLFQPVRDPVASYPPERPDGVVRASISTARLGRAMLATQDPPLRMAWIERGNPVTQNPETSAVLRALRALEFRVVVDQFLTDTAREADIVLPAKSPFEQTDVIDAYWHPYIQLKPKLIDPPGEVKPESEIYALLAARLGIAPERVAAAFPGPADADVEAWLERRLTALPGIDLERLRRGPVLAPGHQEIAFSDLVFPTPSGRIELLSEEAARRWGVDPLPAYREPDEAAHEGCALRSRYPLHLLTPNSKNRIHSQFNNLRLIRDLSRAPRVRIHPLDAASRGVRDGDPVNVFNDRGRLRLPARLDYGIRPGCVSVTNGWWITEGGTVNFLSLGRETDMGHGAAFHDNLVEVERSP